MPPLARRAFIGATASSLGIFSVAKAPARAAEFELKLGSVLTADHPAIAGITAMSAAVEKESGGRVHIAVFPNNVLGNEAAMFTQLRVGALQFMIISPSFLSSVVPAAEISNLGFVFKNEVDAMRVMDGPLGNYVRDQIATKGIYALRGMMDAGMYHIGSSSRPIRTPDDLHGFKIRVAGKIAVDLFKDLGADSVSLNLAEVYTALQTKLVDGVATTVVVMETARFFEVQKYFCMTNHAWAAEWLIANADVWKGLPPDLQGIVERNHARYLTSVRSAMIAANAATVGKLRAHGMIVNDVDQGPFLARLQSYYQTWAAAFGPTAWGLLETSIGRKLT